MCFDWLFNMQVPDSTATIIVQRPTGKTFINGLAQEYSDEYNEKAFEGYLTRREFQTIMESINDALFSYFPCPMCLFCGYFLALPTLGLSLLMPNIGIRDAENQVRRQIEKANIKKLREKGVELVLRKKCSTSWLEFRILRDRD